MNAFLVEIYDICNHGQHMQSGTDQSCCLCCWSSAAINARPRKRTAVTVSSYKRELQSIRWKSSIRRAQNTARVWVKADQRYLEKWREPRSLSKNNISLLSHQRVALVASAAVWVCMRARHVLAKAERNTLLCSNKYPTVLGFFLPKKLKLILYEPYFCMGMFC
jgi:hypothetical protein